MVNIITFILGLLLFCSGCGSQIDKPQLPKLNIAFQKWVGYGLFYLADEKGFLQDEGIDLVFVDENLDSARRDAFKQGMLDCEAGTIDLLIAKRAQDTPVVAIMEIDYSWGSDGIVAVNDIKEIEDLKGRRIAFARDDVGETLLSYLFYKRGMSLDDVTIIPSLPDEAWKTIRKGAADAVVTWEPWLSRAAETPNTHMLVTTKDEPEIIIDTLNVREDLIETHPELLKKLMRGWFSAMDFYKKNPEEASRIIARYYDITPEKYREDVKGLKWVTYNLQFDSDCVQNRHKSFNSIVEIKFSNKRIQKKPSTASSFNMKLLKELYEVSQ